jgi:tetratricopeptide (TPR) repeat protein
MQLGTKLGGVRLFGLFLLVLCAGCSRPADKEARFLRRGKAAMASKDYARAAIEFRNAIDAMPKDAEPYYQLARVFMARQSAKDAVPLLLKATALNPGHADAQLWLAAAMTTTANPGILADAEARVKGVLATMPDNAQALDTLAAAEMRLGKVDDAVKHLEEAFAKAPQNIGAAVNLARMKAAQKDFAGAEDVLRKLARDAPKSVSAALLLAHLYRTSGRKDEAAAEVRRALQLDPKSADALTFLAALQIDAGHAELAEQTYHALSALPGTEYKTAYAVYLFREGKRGQAVAELEKIVKQNPDDRDFRNLLVSAYVRQLQYTEAAKVVEAALKRNPKDVDALLQRADFSVSAGKLSEAEQDLASVLKFKPNSAQAHLLLGRVYGLKGSDQHQHQELSEAVRLDPNLLVARLELASLLNADHAPLALAVLDQAPDNQKSAVSYVETRNWVLFALGKTEEVSKNLGKVLAIGRPPDLVYQDAILKLSRQDYAGARQSLEEVLKAYPESTPAVQALAISYSADGKMPKALEILREKASARPQSAPLHHLLGVWLDRAGLRGEARQAFGEAVSSAPGFVPAAIALAAMDVRDGNLDGARKRIAIVVANHPENIQARLLLAETEEGAGNQPAAVEQYKAVVDRDPRNLMALNNLANGLTRDHPDEALKYAQNAIELAPDEPSVQDTMGWIYYRKGIYQQAIGYLKKAVDKQATPARQYHLGLAYAKTGDRRLASQYILEALKQDPKLAVTGGDLGNSTTGR